MSMFDQCARRPQASVVSDADVLYPKVEISMNNHYSLDNMQCEYIRFTYLPTTNYFALLRCTVQTGSSYSSQ